MNLSEAIRQLIADPEDLTNLPAILAQAEQMETGEADYQERIVKLQKLNKEYFNQIPVVAVIKPPEQEEKEVTFEDAQNELVKAMQNMGGNF